MKLLFHGTIESIRSCIMHHTARLTSIQRFKDAVVFNNENTITPTQIKLAATFQNCKLYSLSQF